MEAHLTGNEGGRTTMKRRLLALMLALAMLFSMTTGAFAEDAEPVIVQEAPAQEEVVQEEPVKEEPAKEESAKEEPKQEEPAKEEPVKEEPAQEEPVQEEEPAQEEEPEQEMESIYPVYGACGEEAVWVLTENGDLTISGKGEMDDYSDEDSQPWAVYSLEIRSVTVEKKITSIGDAAFYGEYENLETVCLPDTLERIGDHAFEGCLKLEEIDLPEAITEIGKDAFKDCDALRRATFAGDAEAFAALTIGSGNEALTDVLEAPKAEEPATEEPATEEPATEAPATEAPATEEPATEEPETEEPAVEEPATEESAVDHVISLIDAIGDVTIESESAIAAAMEAYDALTDEEKALVSNYDTLEAAVAAYMSLNGVALLAEETTPAADAKVYVTISNVGRLALVDGEVTVTDINADGVLTYDEALQAAHTAYCAGGYEATESSYGLFVTKLWGVANGGSYLFFKNGVALEEAVNSANSSVSAGDRLYAAVLKDAATYSDIQALFDKDRLTATAGEAFTLTLTGMPYGGGKTAVSGVQLGVWKDGAFTAIDGAVTDENGQASITLSKNGDYIITAEGSMGTSPIMPPVCRVTVEGGAPVRHYLSELRYLYTGNKTAVQIELQEGVFEYTIEIPTNATMTSVRMGAQLSADAPAGATIKATYKQISTGRERTVTLKSSPTAYMLMIQLVTPGTAENMVSITVGAGSDTQVYTLHIARSPYLELTSVRDSDGADLTLLDGTYYVPEDCASIKITADSYKADLTINGQPAVSNEEYKVTPVWSEDDSFVVTLCASIGEKTYVVELPMKKMKATDEFSGDCGADVKWSLKDGVLNISGSGAMADYAINSPAPWAGFKSIIRSVVVQEGVTGIGSFAFFKHPALESAILPAGLKSIGVCAFGDCGKLSEAALPEGLTHLGNEAFKSTALKSVVLPESLETLDGRAFAECAALESATINGKLSVGLFEECTSLKNVTFNGNALKTIPGSVFSLCAALEEIEIPEGVTEIIQLGCSPKKITLPSTLETLNADKIGYGVTDLTINNNDRFVKRDGIVYSADGKTIILCEKGVAGNIVIPDGAIVIGESAFRNCREITGIQIPASVKSIGRRAFWGDNKLASVALPEGLTSIGESAFFECTALEGIDIPDSVTDLGDSVFSGCTALKTLEIPAGVTVIVRGMFANCSALKSIVVHTGVTSIESDAFAYIQIGTICYRGGVDEWNAVTGAGKPADGSYEIVYYYGRNDVATITEQPKDCMLAQHSAAENALSITVTAPTEGDGKVSFAWYAGDTNSTSGGAAVEGTVSEDGLTAYCAPSTAEQGSKYYYCVVTTTMGDGAELKAPSRAAKVEIVPYKWSGEGTAEAPYELATAEDLLALYDYVASGENAQGKYFRMTADITLPEGWKPIGITKDGKHDIRNGENLLPFSGNLDGNGKTLTVPEGGLPLLGYVKGAKVSNLNIYGKRIAGYGLVNYLEGVGLAGEAICIDNVTLKSGSSTLKSGLIGTYITTNGFAGCSAAFYVTIRNCTVESGVVIGYDKSETMIGSIAGRVHGTISNCTSAATVYGKNYVGGILGTRDNAMGECRVTDCTFTGSVIASGEQVGGIVGGGYSNSTAPNGGKIPINGCTVSGSVRGADMVGGILGADAYVAQSWGGYTMKNNRFTGKVSGDGSAVGGIIGYYLSMNKCDDIADNYYASGCGAQRGIGHVKYVDTNCATHETDSRTSYFSTENDVSQCPVVKGCGWRTGYNRTDDPLGADAAKLTYTDGSTVIDVTGIALDKNELALKTGDTAKLTATVTPDNATDKTVRWTSSDETIATVQDGVVTAVKEGKATITAKAGDMEARCEVTVQGLPKLAALTFRNGIQAAKTEFALTPAFDPEVREYTITVPDSLSGVGDFAIWATLAEGAEGKIEVQYVNQITNRTKKVNVTSGNTNGAPLANSIKRASLETVVLTIKIGGQDAYTVNVQRELTLSTLNFTAGEKTYELDQKLTTLTREYSALVPHDAELTVNAVPQVAEGVTMSYNGEASNVIKPVWNGRTAQLSIKLSADGAQDGLYTVQLNQMPAKLEVITAPKTEYAAGDTFDPTGMVLQATYADGSTETAPADQVTFAPTEPLTKDITSVKLTYCGTEVELPITVTGGLKGSGTAEDPWLIETYQDFETVRDLVSKGLSFDGEYLKMVNDITLPEGWTPIGVTKDGTNNIQSGANLLPFSGNLDCSGKTLTIPEGGLPLLGYVKGATVSNLNIYGKKIAGYGLVNNYSGVGLNVRAITIDNVTLKSGSSTLKSGLIGTYLTTNGFAGASAGFVVDIRNCTVESGVVIGYNKDQEMIGSIAGRVQGTITNCTSAATVYGTNYVGGIIGTRDNAMGTCKVTDCTFTGSVIASGEHAGGIVGGGYSNDSAPNGIKITVQNCKVSGSVTGADKVGGILGGDSFVAQAWNAYRFTDNSFTGKVSGSGGAVGGVIGYLRSLNKFDDIANNYYASGCGAKYGIGAVQYVDTNCETHETERGATYFNTETSTADCPTVKWCSWKKAHNRTDDPLGADAAKLTYTDGSTVIDVTGIALDKNELALKTGDTAKLTATVTPDNATDKTVRWTSSDDAIATVSEDGTITAKKAGTVTITAAAGSFTAKCTVAITEADAIKVTISVLGDSAHGSGKVHTLKNGGLSTWVKATEYSVPGGSTVWDVVKKCLDEHNLSYSNPTGNYVSSVNGLAEFDNGKNSGWMYTLNGKYPLNGVSKQKVKDGDRIIFHYTDDYTLEDTGFSPDPDDNERVAEVEKKIDAIGDVTYTEASKAKIDAARKAYNDLTVSERKNVDNYQKLLDAEKKYSDLKKQDDQAKADAVKKLIDEMGNDQDKIKEARKAYDDLTKDQKKLVTNYNKLTAAEYQRASSTATSSDRKSAQDTIDLIAQIGDKVSDTSGAKIDAARKAYDKLSDTQKVLVTNYEQLEAAEEAYARLAGLKGFENLYRETGNLLTTLGEPGVGSVGGEWMVIGLARSGREIDADLYYTQVSEYVAQVIDENERLHRNKSTENSRIILALTALGMDVHDVNGHDLTAGLNDMAYIQKQGINGPIWALIALDSNAYEPAEGDVTREALIQCILDAQLEDGGWAFSGENADSDMTGMALTALAPYYVPETETEDGTKIELTEAQIAINEAVERGVECLSELQFANGAFGTFGGNGEIVETSESTAQAVVALTALNIDPDTDERFVKNGNSALDALVSYGLTGGGFKHLMDGERDGMATEQGYYALTAYARYLMGLNRLYDMCDAFDPEAELIQPLDLYIRIVK